MFFYHLDLSQILQKTKKINKYFIFCCQNQSQTVISQQSSCTPQNVEWLIKDWNQSVKSCFAVTQTTMICMYLYILYLQCAKHLSYWVHKYTKLFSSQTFRLYAYVVLALNTLLPRNCDGLKMTDSHFRLGLMQQSPSNPHCLPHPHYRSPQDLISQSAKNRRAVMSCQR